MAKPRKDLFISVTWLSKIMSEDIVCEWQPWFQTHNELTERQPDDFDLVQWRIDHARMLNDLSHNLSAKGLKPMLSHQVKYKLPGIEATIKGTMDCLVVNGNEVMVYDCKTGHPRTSDQVQIMIYMYMLSHQPAFAGKSLGGEVVYRDRTAEVPFIPDSIEPNLKHYVGLFVSSTPPSKMPGRDCKFCPITKIDCDERIDVAVDD